MASHKVFVQGHGDYRINLNRGVSGTVHVLKPKEHTDVTVYVSGLFQEDRFVAVSALAIQSIFNTLVTQQTIAGTDSIGLTSSIGDITNIVEIALASLIGLNSSASLSKSMDYSGAAEVGLRSDIDGVIGNLISGADNLGVSFAIDLLTVGAEFDAESELGILSVLDTLLKAAYFEAAEQLGLDSAAHFLKALLFPDSQADIGIASIIDGQLAKYIYAANSIGITSSIDAMGAYKMIEASSAFTISPILSSLIKKATLSADGSLGIDGNATVTFGQLYDGNSVIALRSIIDATIHSCIDAIDELGVNASMESMAYKFLQTVGAVGIDANVSAVSKDDIQAESAISIDFDASLGYVITYSGHSSFAIDGTAYLNFGKPIDGGSSIGINLDASSLLTHNDYAGESDLGILVNDTTLVKCILSDVDDRLGIIEVADFAQGDYVDADGRIGIDGVSNIIKVSIIDGDDEIGFEFDPDDPVISAQFIIQNEFTIDANAGMLSDDIFNANDSTGISASGGYASTDFIAGGMLITIDASADFSKTLIRLRLLSDMDEFNMSDFDDMTLGELTYIEIID